MPSRLETGPERSPRTSHVAHPQQLPLCDSPAFCHNPATRSDGNDAVSDSIVQGTAMSLLSLAADRFRRTSVYRHLRLRRHRAEFQRWVKSGGQSAPPHLVKQQLIRRYATRYRCSALVETGTYKGDMLLAMLYDFRRLYSIELHPKLHDRARQLFLSRPQVRLYQGDSGEKIADVLNELNEPAVFWLDGHFSAGQTAKAELNTPIIAELDQVLQHRIRSHVVLIDDARLFNGTEDYPTLEAVAMQVARAGQYDMRIEDDVIAIVRKAA